MTAGVIGRAAGAGVGSSSLWVANAAMGAVIRVRSKPRREGGGSAPSSMSRRPRVGSWIACDIEGLSVLRVRPGGVLVAPRSAALALWRRSHYLVRTKWQHRVVTNGSADQNRPPQPAD